MHGVDRRAGPGQRLDLRRRLAHPQRAQHLAGQPLRDTGQGLAQRERLLGPHPVGEAHAAGAAQRPRDERVRVGAVAVVDDAHPGARRR